MLARNSLAGEEHTWRHLLWVESNTRRRWSAELTWTEIRFSEHAMASFQASFLKGRPGFRDARSPSYRPVSSSIVQYVTAERGTVLLNLQHKGSLLSRVCTYHPGSSSNGSQSHQHHTHSKHTAGGQHAGQRDPSVPCRHVDRAATNSFKSDFFF